MATCAAQPPASCCLNPCRSAWNISLSSGEGWFHLTIELQNHKRLCLKSNQTTGFVRSLQIPPWRCLLDLPAPLCIALGMPNLSLHCPGSRTGLGTKLEQIQGDEVPRVRDASVRCGRLIPQHSRVGCEALSDAEVWG